MTLQEFIHGSQSERAVWTWQEGLFLADRSWQEYRVCLYHMGEFFAEVYYQRVTHQVNLIMSFKNPELLMPYQDQINLPDITGN